MAKGLKPLPFKTPRTMALAVRIYGYANPRGWDVSLAEIAKALEIKLNSAHAIVQAAGWADRLRQTTSRTAFTETRWTPAALGRDDTRRHLGYVPDPEDAA